MAYAYDQRSPYLIAGEMHPTQVKGKAYSNILSYQRTLEMDLIMGFLSTNRFYQEGGNGQVIGINGLLRFAKLYTLTLN